MSDLEAVGKGYGGSTPQRTLSSKLRPPEPRIQTVNAKDQGIVRKEMDLSKLELVGQKIGKGEEFSGTPLQRERKGSRDTNSPAAAGRLRASNSREKARAADVKENLRGGGGFSVPDVYMEKTYALKKRPPHSPAKKAVEQPDSEKRQIMQQMGIEKSDMDDYFDVLQDRVYRNDGLPPADDEVHERVESRVGESFNATKLKQEQLLRRKAELEAEKQRLLEEKQIARDRLYGRLRTSPSSGVLGSVQNSLLAPPPVQVGSEDDFNQFGQLAALQAAAAESSARRKELIHNFLNEEQPGEEELVEVKKLNQDRNKELEYLYFKRKREAEKEEQELKLTREKFEKGIIVHTPTQAEREYQSFEDEFKNYVRDRRKKNEQQKMLQSTEKKEFELYQSTSKNPVRLQAQPMAPFRENISTLLPEEERKKIRLAQSGIQQRDGSAEKKSQEEISKELQMIQALFHHLDKDQLGAIEKNELSKHLITKRQDICQLYNIDESNLQRELATFKSRNRNLLTSDELAKFLKQARPELHNRQDKNIFAEEVRQSRQLAKKQLQGTTGAEDTVGNCLLDNSQVQILRSVFETVDREKDWVVSRTKLVEALRNDVRVIKILHTPAVFLQSIGKSLTVERVLYRIEKEALFGTAEEKRAREYVTWNQFFEYFSDTAHATSSTVEQKQFKIFTNIVQNTDDQNQFDLSEEAKTVLREAFDSCEKQSQVFVSTVAFTNAVKMHARYLRVDREIGRRKAANFDREEEAFGDVLERIEREGDEFLEWDEILEYFTRRGHPKSQSAQGKSNQQHHLATGVAAAPPSLRTNEQLFNKSLQAKESRQKIGGFHQQQKETDDTPAEIEGYDSDPETHIYSRGFYPQQAGRLKKKGLASSNKSLLSLSQSRHDEDSDEYSKRPLAVLPPRKLVLEEKDLRRTESARSPFGTQELQSRFGGTTEERFGSANRLLANEEKFTSSKVRFADDLNVAESRVHSLGTTETQQRFRVLDADKPLNEQRLTVSKVGRYQSYSPAARKMSLNSSEKSFPLTKPEPYQFDEREKMKKFNTSIRQSKLQEMIRESKLKESEAYNYVFKAKPVPQHVKQPLFEKIMREQEERRKEVHDNSIAITLTREKPFTFYKRDQEKKHKRKNAYEREKFVFKAKKVPWFCQVDLLKKINEEEEVKRQERKVKEAQRIMNMSKLPPRMEMWKQQEEQLQMEVRMGLREAKSERAHSATTTAQSHIAREIPDFETLHRKFQEALDRTRQNKRTTVPQEPNFQPTKKAVRREYLDVENQMQKTMKEKPKVDKIEEARKWRTQKPEYIPPSTKKFEAQVEKLRRERDKKQEDEAKRLAEEEERKKRYEKPRVQHSEALKQDTKKREEDEKKKKEKFDRDWKAASKKSKIEIKNAKQKAYDTPLLIERPPLREKQLQKYKALNKMLAILQKNKVNQNDLKNMFTREEINMIEDLKFIKQNYPKYFAMIEEEDNAGGNKGY